MFNAIVELLPTLRVSCSLMTVDVDVATVDVDEATVRVDVDVEDIAVSAGIELVDDSLSIQKRTWRCGQI